jgi:hypothetical protein
MSSKVEQILKKKIKFYGTKPRFKYSQKELRVGIKTEKEHTRDKKIAKAIAFAHLEEDKKYYTKLKKAKL